MLSFNTLVKISHFLFVKIDIVSIIVPFLLIVVSSQGLRLTISCSHPYNWNLGTCRWLGYTDLWLYILKVLKINKSSVYIHFYCLFVFPESQHKVKIKGLHVYVSLLSWKQHIIMEGNGTLGQQVGPVAFTDVGTLESREMSELGRVIMPINDSECFSHHPKMSSQLPSSFRSHEDFPYLQCDICTAFPCITKIRVSCSARNCYSACDRTEVKCMALQ